METHDNNFSKKSQKKKKATTEIRVLKYSILAIIILVPVLLIFMVSVNNQKLAMKNGGDEATDQSKPQTDTKTQSSGENFHFNAPIPSDKAGDISKVSKDKIDSLFDNIKE